MADLQIATRIEESGYETWSALAIVTTEQSRVKKRIPVADESKMLAVAFALASRIEANRAKKYSESGLKFLAESTPSVGLHNYGIHAYVKIETLNGSKAGAQEALAAIDRAVKDFKLSDIGL